MRIIIVEQAVRPLYLPNRKRSAGPARQSKIVLCSMRAAMSPGASANYYHGNILYIDEGVEIFRTSEIGKMDDIVSHLRAIGEQIMRDLKERQSPVRRTRLRADWKPPLLISIGSRSGCPTILYGFDC